MRKTGRYTNIPGKPMGDYRPTRSEFEDVEVVVLAERDDQGAFLMRELQRLRVALRHVWPLPPVLPSDADVVYVDYAADLSRRLPWLPGEAKSALVVILPQVDPVDTDAVANATPDAILARPFTANAIKVSLVLARSQFRYEQRMRTKVDRLDENLRSMRTVERAKAILMSTRQLADAEAYNFIRCQAMDRRISVASVAAAIVSSYELLGPAPK